MPKYNRSRASHAHLMMVLHVLYDSVCVSVTELQPSCGDLTKIDCESSSSSRLSPLSPAAVLPWYPKTAWWKDDSGTLPHRQRSAKSVDGPPLVSGACVSVVPIRVRGHTAPPIMATADGLLKLGGYSSVCIFHRRLGT